MCGIKNRHLIGRRNDVTANMATLAVCMCLTASRLLDTPRSSVWVSQGRLALAQKFTVIVWCEGTALAIGMWVIFFAIWVLYLSALWAAESLFSMASKLLGQKACLASVLPYWLRKDMTRQFF